MALYHVFDIIASMMLVLLTSIVLHELGHIGTYYFFKRKFPSSKKFLSPISEEDANGLTDRQYLKVAGIGIITGLIPIYLSLYIFNEEPYFTVVPTIVLAVFYAWGCKHDWKQINEVTKHGKC